MKLLLVLTFELDEPENVVDVIRNMNLASLPGFSGEGRIVVDPEATRIEKWLDE